ncbi:ABC transporter permease [Actinocrinis puniceicyclus]|uniref:Xylose transport system permease protein XylH n=1 Tax=Actinocrinis puniceicyclus TaxID=977794 RepID=A0A8J7WNQ2_9ACTN|nr:ABC transporter permease [Actinocrinis puniceicyclus]MBS2963077.1 ABC transporter permease [Actinocrinis puniceicyclus]
MSEMTDSRAGAAPVVTAAVPRSLGESFYNYRQRVRTGEIGALPAVIGIVLLLIIFSFAQTGFLSLSSFISILQESAPTITLAMGLVFVLLLGEIDLSAGVVGSTAAAFGAILSVKHGIAWPLAIIGAAAFGAVAGSLLGWLRARIGIPSFVVTLAAFISFQGAQILVIGSSSGQVSIGDKILLQLDNGRLSPVLGWVYLVIAVVAYTAVKLMQVNGRRRQGLASEPMSLLVLRIGALIVGGAIFVYFCNVDEALTWQQRQGIHIRGVPWVVPIIAAMLVVLSFALDKTRYGRHVYAVGGNDEAARRAGIPVRLIRTSVFVICSTMAAFSGLFLASELNGVNTQEGGGNVLLLAVAAAVIGGTSLMGGRGRVVDAVLGGLALAILQYGMSNLIKGGNASAYQYIITGIVLLLAAAVDALSRHAGRSTS